MKLSFRQFAVILTTLLALTANGLANALPINGLNTGEISDRFQVYFVPAGYVFSIWGLIYLGLIAFTIFQALPSQSGNSRLPAAAWWVAAGNLANTAWIFLWHYLVFPLTLVVMFFLLASLLMVYLKLGIGQTQVPAAERWAVRLPFSIYLGWISVAAIANATDLLAYLNWNGFGLPPETWLVIMLAAVVLITALMLFTRRDYAYAAVILWALAGIAVKFAAVPAAALPAWSAFGLTAACLAAALVLRPTRRASLPAAQ